MAVLCFWAALNLAASVTTSTLVFNYMSHFAPGLSYCSCLLTGALLEISFLDRHLPCYPAVAGDQQFLAALNTTVQHVLQQEVSRDHPVLTAQQLQQLQQTASTSAGKGNLLKVTVHQLPPLTQQQQQQQVARWQGHGQHVFRVFASMLC
jgi:hypothetical protein